MDNSVPLGTPLQVRESLAERIAVDLHAYQHPEMPGRLRNTADRANTYTIESCMDCMALAFYVLDADWYTERVV